MKTDIEVEVFDDWHPRFDMASEATGEYFRSMYFKPDFINNAITYVVSMRKYKRGITKEFKEFEFTELKEAVDCYNDFEED